MTDNFKLIDTEVARAFPSLDLRFNHWHDVSAQNSDRSFDRITVQVNEVLHSEYAVIFESQNPSDDTINTAISKLKRHLSKYGLEVDG